LASQAGALEGLGDGQSPDGGGQAVAREVPQHDSKRPTRGPTGQQQISVEALERCAGETDTAVLQRRGAEHAAEQTGGGLLLPFGLSPEIFEAQLLGVELPKQGSPPERRPEPRLQDGSIVRFCNIIVGPGFQGVGQHFFVGEGGQHQDRDEGPARDRFHLPSSLDAVDAGHHHVKEHQVREVLSKAVQGHLSRLGLHHLVSLRGQESTEDHSAALVVIDQQNASGLHGLS
jgi:hypothetical protein